MTELAAIKIWVTRAIEAEKNSLLVANPLTLDGQATLARSQAIVHFGSQMLTDDFRTQIESLASEQ